MKHKRKKWKLEGGPYNGDSLYLTDGGTLEFSVGEFQGSYIKGMWISTKTEDILDRENMQMCIHQDNVLCRA